MQSATITCTYCHSVLDVTNSADENRHQDTQSKIGRYAIRIFQISMAMQDDENSKGYAEAVRLLQNETRAMYQEIADYLNSIEAPHGREDHPHSNSHKSNVFSL